MNSRLMNFTFPLPQNNRASARFQHSPLGELHRSLDLQWDSAAQKRFSGKLMIPLVVREMMINMKPGPPGVRSDTFDRCAYLIMRLSASSTRRFHPRPLAASPRARTTGSPVCTSGLSCERPLANAPWSRAMAECPPRQKCSEYGPARPGPDPIGFERRPGSGRLASCRRAQLREPKTKNLLDHHSS